MSRHSTGIGNLWHATTASGPTKQIRRPAIKLQSRQALLGAVSLAVGAGLLLLLGLLGTDQLLGRDTLRLLRLLGASGEGGIPHASQHQETGYDRDDDQISVFHNLLIQARATLTSSLLISLLRRCIGRTNHPKAAAEGANTGHSGIKNLPLRKLERTDRSASVRRASRDASPDMLQSQYPVVGSTPTIPSAS